MRGRSRSHARSGPTGGEASPGLDISSVGLALASVAMGLSSPTCACRGETGECYDWLCEPPAQHCSGDRAATYCAYRTCPSGREMPFWADLPCPSPAGFDWRCVNLPDGRAECREVGADRCDPPGAWGCDGTWVTYCSTSGYLGHVLDCATEEMNPVCAVRDGGKAALCTYTGAGPCTLGEGQPSWCDGDYLTDCGPCLFSVESTLPDPRAVWLDTDAGLLNSPYWPFACYEELWALGYPVHLRRCPAGCSEEAPYGADCRSTP